MSTLDRRIAAFRPDLADRRLEGKVTADRFVAGQAATIAAPVADLRASPDPEAGLDTQLLRGDHVRVFEERGEWAWVQCAHDGYVGYARREALARHMPAATHVVAARATFLYPAPDMKRPAIACHSMGAALTVEEWVEERSTRYARVGRHTFTIAAHLRPVGECEADYAGVAERLLGAPYLWGGASAFGLDCSGLVQLAMRMAGRNVLRDTDMQAGSIGTAIDPGESNERLHRGDLVFWKGHVGIMLDGKTLLHANGHSMDVAREPLAAAIARIARLYGQPTGWRRP